jgi:hypothetical protein
MLWAALKIIVWRKSYEYNQSFGIVCYREFIITNQFNPYWI